MWSSSLSLKRKKETLNIPDTYYFIYIWDGVGGGWKEGSSARRHMYAYS